MRTCWSDSRNAVPAAEYLAAAVPLAVALLLHEASAPLAGPLLGRGAIAMMTLEAQEEHEKYEKVHRDN